MEGTGTTTFTFKVGKGLSGLKVYHNDNPLDKVTSERDLSVEKFYYDSANGIVKFVTDSYSPFTIVFNSPVALVNGVSYYKLQDALNVGGEVVILKDIDLGISCVTINSSKNVTLDLNGKTIKSYDDVINNKGTLVVKDNTSKGKIVSTRWSGIAIYDNSVTTIESGNIESIEGAIITGYATGATLNVKGGTLSASDNAVIAGNGTRREGEPNTFNISGGTLNGNIKTSGYVACGIYSPWKDIVNFTGGTINAVNGSGIVARAGNVTVSGGTINTTGNSTGKVGDSRVVVPCSALVFDSDANYPAMTADSKISVSGGTFNSEVAAVTTVDEVSRINITGGTFSSDPTNYLANGYAVNEENGRHVVYQGTIVCTVAELQAAMNPEVKDGVAVISLANDLELKEGETWTSLNMHAYGDNIHEIVINGNGHTINGLNGPLIDKAYFGNTSIEINNLTLSNSDVHVDGNYAAAFINYGDRCNYIKLTDCHLKDSTIEGSKYAGGLISYTSSTNLVIDRCSVKNSQITGESVGAIAGMFSVGDGNDQPIEVKNVTVTDNNLISTSRKTYRVGELVGSSTRVEVKLNSISTSGNTRTQENSAGKDNDLAISTKWFGRSQYTVTGDISEANF